MQFTQLFTKSLKKHLEGFSLLEVLIALLLINIIAIGILQQQWLIEKSLQQMWLKYTQSQQQYNNNEK